MPPSPRVLEWLEKLESINARSIADLDPTEARKEDVRTTLPFLTAPEPVERIENRVIREGGSEVPVRFYWPKIATDEKEQGLHPLIVYFHGGGWVVGKLDMFDEICSMLSNRSDAIVVSVDYRLAPEHKFPVPIQDCYSVTKWVADKANILEGDRDTLVLAGDSAGGTLAIDVSLMARKEDGPQIAMVVPICPVTDISRDMSRFSNDRFGPSKEVMDWFITRYVGHESDLRNPLASPVFADLSGMPYTVLITAELDPLKEQEIDFAMKLEQSGVKVKRLDYPGMIHGFMTLPGYFDEGRQAIEAVGSEVRNFHVENAA